MLIDADDFICVHRLPSSPTMKNYTLLYIEKIKDIDTGGQITEFDSPLMLDFNNGYGFKINGVNPLKDEHIEMKEGYQQQPLKPSLDFEIEQANKELGIKEGKTTFLK